MSHFATPPRTMSPVELAEALEELQPLIHGAIVRAEEDRDSERLAKAAKRVGDASRSALESLNSSYGTD